MQVSFFSVCGPKFTKFGVHVGEWLQFPTQFSSRRYLVPVRRYSQSNREIRNFDVFRPPNFLGEGPPNFWLNFKNYSHHRTCRKVWWRSAQRPPRLSDKKKIMKRIETSAVKYNGRRPASWRAAIITV